MVKSRLHKEIQYKETYAIDPDDIGFETSIYDLTLFNRSVEIALGKPKYEYSSKHVVYFPIYLLVNEDPVSKIGIYEIPDQEMIHSIDEDDDFNITEKNVIIYIKENYFNRILDKKGGPMAAKPPSTATATTPSTQTMTTSTTQPAAEEDDVFSLKIPDTKKSPAVKHAEEVTKQGIFTNNTSVIAPAPLQEETQADVAETRKAFKEGPRNLWIQNFMKNQNFDLIDNEAGGDCLFAVIRDAFRQIGKDTTVEKLRAMLSREVTDDLVQNYNTIYLNLLANLQATEAKQKAVKSNSKLIKTRIDNAKDKRVHSELVSEAKKLVDEYGDIQKEMALTKEYMTEFAYMKDIGNNTEKFREFVQTRDFWADSWAISTIERLLNIKVIIFSQHAFDIGDFDSVMQCGELSDTDLSRQGKYKPDFYIMTSYKNNNHYMLASYKEKNIFKFPEIPFGVKTLVINKCMERNSGPYYLIDDFRLLKTRLGLPANEGEYNSDDEAEDSSMRDRDIFENDVVLQFYAKSDPKPKAGKGTGEKIPDIRLLDFIELNKIKDWRRMLDDSWSTKFTIDGKQWQTVEHYFLGSQFRKGFPDFYKQFSLDSGSDISKDMELARSAGEKSAVRKDVVHNGIVLRPKTTTIDADFYEVKAEPRHEIERGLAVEAKFTQNLDLKRVLLETKNAKLVKFVRSHPPVPDILLMKLRKSLTTKN